MSGVRIGRNIASGPRYNLMMALIMLVIIVVITVGFILLSSLGLI